MRRPDPRRSASRRGSPTAPVPRGFPDPTCRAGGGASLEFFVEATGPGVHDPGGDGGEWEDAVRLLIVEGDGPLSGALAGGFRDEGFAVDQAFDGPDGLHAALSGEYELVVLDLLLPGVDGLRVLQELRRQGNRVPVVF